jgi:hypothetical protein
MAMFGGGRFSKALRRGLPSEGTHVIDLDARVPPPSTAAASTDQVTPPGTQREIAQALPGNLGKLNRAKRDSERRKTPRAKAAYAVRTSSAAFKAAQKMWHSKNTAANPGRKSSVAYKAAQKNIGQLLKLRQLQQDDNLLLRIKQQRKSGIQSVGQLLKPRQPSESLTAIAVSPSVTLPGLWHEIIDCSVAARRAGAGIEMNSSTQRRKHAHDIQWDNWIMNDYIRVAVFIVMPALLLGLPLCM